MVHQRFASVDVSSLAIPQGSWQSAFQTSMDSGKLNTGISFENNGRRLLLFMSHKKMRPKAFADLVRCLLPSGPSHNIPVEFLAAQATRKAIKLPDAVHLFGVAVNRGYELLVGERPELVVLNLKAKGKKSGGGGKKNSENGESGPESAPESSAGGSRRASPSKFGSPDKEEVSPAGSGPVRKRQKSVPAGPRKEAPVSVWWNFVREDWTPAEAASASCVQIEMGTECVEGCFFLSHHTRNPSLLFMSVGHVAHEPPMDFEGDRFETVRVDGDTVTLYVVVRGLKIDSPTEGTFKIFSPLGSGREAQPQESERATAGVKRAAVSPGRTPMGRPPVSLIPLVKPTAAASASARVPQFQTPKIVPNQKKEPVPSTVSAAVSSEATPLPSSQNVADSPELCVRWSVVGEADIGVQEWNDLLHDSCMLKVVVWREDGRKGVVDLLEHGLCSFLSLDFIWINFTPLIHGLLVLHPEFELCTPVWKREQIAGVTELKELLKGRVLDKGGFRVVFADCKPKDVLRFEGSAFLHDRQGKCTYGEMDETEIPVVKPWPHHGRAISWTGWTSAPPGSLGSVEQLPHGFVFESDVPVVAGKCGSPLTGLDPLSLSGSLLSPGGGGV
uniref:Uncharacterized protein n=1 Tax=Chromera velia CCMP2878 TaxID=1169474 RepID=A0A0G4HGN7_9ALVE|eukprot:Cvel_27297.t1-p1 / transcript=Cvel_27297.t1 / gene=Cvel_27297 / organism=Chromera_velia_CCMP2878 / gene_product=hypothetical protein / transcript_product=hypothetical protein / location=Cvel_scaffold3384:1799-3640(-) / protein_length=614 / sequence_SO=supercontig / SO=protein_coding / is_pseudo=false